MSDLAAAARASLWTVKRIEPDVNPPVSGNVHLAIRAAFEATGVSLLPDEDLSGPIAVPAPLTLRECAARYDRTSEASVRVDASHQAASLRRGRRTIARCPR